MVRRAQQGLHLSSGNSTIQSPVGYSLGWTRAWSAVCSGADASEDSGAGGVSGSSTPLTLWRLRDSSAAETTRHA